MGSIMVRTNRNGRKGHRKGYRKHLSPPKKGHRAYKGSQGSMRVNGFCGFSTQALKPIRVLSLFDGIGTGLHVLDKLGLKIEAYFSSEIDEKALRILKYRYGNRITHLGCVTEVTETQLSPLRIDLLVGGSPCSDLSLVNPRRRGLHGQGSSGSLFFDFCRVLGHLQKCAADGAREFYWLFENTASMEKINLEEISRRLGCSPIISCASSHVPMVRKRLFWGNIPGLNVVREIGVPAFYLQDILKPYRCANASMLPTITSTSHSQRHGKAKSLPVDEDGRKTHLLITEEEVLFGFPAHYTDGPNLSITDRRKLLGKAWCVPVVEELLRPLATLFLTTLGSTAQSPEPDENV